MTPTMTLTPSLPLETPKADYNGREISIVRCLLLSQASPLVVRYIPIRYIPFIITLRNPNLYPSPNLNSYLNSYFNPNP